ncbi:MAG: RNA polymerase factor sigma-54 [Gemmataceae bacterium]|nr:RNA polymerase factor sigma-54 [Gemmataceae bacterium]MDW8242273.1 RNA polymerase factor sigma-54 [Thermogemmata sp.]
MSSLRLGMDMQLIQGQKMILAPRMIQSMEILQLPLTDLQARIERELQENPFLEVREKLGAPETTRHQDEMPVEPLSYDDGGASEYARLEQLNREWEGVFDEDSEPRISRAAAEEAADRKLEVMANMPARPPSLQDHLAAQIAEWDLGERQRRLALHICSYIDRTGYLGTRLTVGAGRSGKEGGEEIFRPVSLSEIAASFDDQPVSVEEVEDVLINVVQKLDPPGVGARSIAECLLLQITEETPYAEVLRVLIRDHLEDIAHNRIPAIQRATRWDIPTIQAAIEALRHHLDPKPGLRYATGEARYVLPDVIVERSDDGQYTVRLVEDWVPPIRISRRTVALLRRTDLDEKVRAELRKKLQAADWLVKAVEQRRNTLLKVTQAIIERQRPFLEWGPEHIQPLKMQQIAEQVGVHVTTVSRAVDDKWVQTPRGLFPLKRFFGGGKANEQTGEDVAYEVIKQKLLELIAQEDKANPLSDEELVARLNAAGYPVKRRTVTKYRQLLNIPSSRQRKDWSRAELATRGAAESASAVPPPATDGAPAVSPTPSPP